MHHLSSLNNESLVKSGFLIFPMSNFIVDMVQNISSRLEYGNSKNHPVGLPIVPD
jgi:hypothetical protein